MGDGQAQHRTSILRHCLTDKDFNWSVYVSSPPATQICSDNVLEGTRGNIWKINMASAVHWVTQTRTTEDSLSIVF